MYKCSQSLNILYLIHSCTYKTCEHSEGCNGKPNMNYVEDLKQNFDVKVSIHESDPKRQYKMQIMNYFKENSHDEHLYEAIKQITYKFSCSIMVP